MAVGDINKDGRQDLIIGANRSPGEVYILKGRPRAEFGSGPIRVTDPSFGATLTGKTGNIGYSVAAGDVNGDGIDDMILSDSVRTVGSRINAGEVYLVLGSTVFPTGSLTVDQQAHQTLVGPHSNAGLNAVFADDFTGDGHADLGLSINFKPLLVSGADLVAEGATVDLSTAQANPIKRMAMGDSLGRIGTWIPPSDFDGDGRPDLFVLWGRDAFEGSLSAYCSHSFPVGSPLPTSLNTSSINWEGVHSNLGHSDFDDINGDGKDDFVYLARNDIDDFFIFYGFFPLENPAISVRPRSAEQARVHLSLSVLGEPTEMKLTGGFLESIEGQWIPFQPEMDLTLTPTEEIKTISVVFRNSVLRESESVSTQLTLTPGSSGTNVVTNLLKEGGAARFEARLEGPGHLKAEVFSREARRLKIIEDEEKGAGVYVLEWDGTNSDGQRVAPGVYVVVVDAGGRLERHKVMVR